MLTRREALTGGLMVAAATMKSGTFGVPALADSNEARGVEVPYSSGREFPKTTTPENACDCHHHIYDPANYPYVPGDVRKQPPATVEFYRLLQKRLRLKRNVIVQPSAYGTDNRCILSALQAMGKSARAIVVVDTTIADSELQSMNALGVRGIRINSASAGKGVAEQDILSLSHRAHELGWHVQFWIAPEQTVRLESVLAQLPSPIVFDHRGHIPQPEGIEHPAFKVICRLIDKGNTWVKLSGLYWDSQSGPPLYQDTVQVGRAFVKHAPQRMIWGTDWPHPTIYDQGKPFPDDAEMFDLLSAQAPDDNLRHRILVENPELLYGFEK